MEDSRRQRGDYCVTPHPGLQHAGSLHQLFYRSVEAAAPKFGVETIETLIRGPEDIEAVMTRVGSGTASPSTMQERERSRASIASAVFDVLRRANVLLIDQPGQSNPETA